MKKTFVISICALCLMTLYPSHSKAYTDTDIDDAMRFLYRYMALPDSTDRSRDFYVEYAVKPALKARDEMAWGANVPDILFRYFVLPLRVNNEALDRHRPIFYNELKPRIEHLSMTDAILEINHWCHEKVTYQPSDGRTHSPLQSVSSAIGRCGEESTFTVAALRAMGIPARQVYTPRWAHTDDNHAWVEAWADGHWHFLGACEPEPVLDLGWFNAPAARGMLMHARVFGNYEGTEESLEHIGGTTIINVTDTYAPTDTLLVTVADPIGQPVAGADVSFRIYNYAEFYPIATKKTDAAGRASLVCGKGDLMVWATDGHRLGYSKASVGRDRDIKIIIDAPSMVSLGADIDMTPPVSRNNIPEVSDAMRKANDRRMTVEDSIRGAYAATFDNSTQLMAASRGNHRVIRDFITQSPDTAKALALLRSLSEKDLTDITADVLADHYAADGNTADPVFASYVMSPRIDVEDLTPFRSMLRKAIGPVLTEKCKTDPEIWVKWVADNITADLSWYPAQVTMSPAAVWKHRLTSPKSRDIFFVAGARAMGIPARIDPVTGKTQWMNGSQWIDAGFDSAATTPLSSKGQLRLVLDTTTMVPDPRYYTHFSLSILRDGAPQLLNLPDFQPWSENFRQPYPLDAGRYLLVTGQRMADGSVMTRLRDITISTGMTTVDTLSLRHDNSRLQVVGSFNSENLYTPLNSQQSRSLLSTTGRGYYILVLLRPNHEPSNHVIRDIAMEGQQLDKLGRSLMVLYDTADSVRVDSEMMKLLPEGVTTVGTADIEALRREISDNNPATVSDYPVVIVADTFNRIVYRSCGYTIGLGQTLTDILNSLAE